MPYDVPFDTHHTPSGTWSDCKPYGAEAELEALLLIKGEDCQVTKPPQCALEALRSPATRCGSACGPVELQSELNSNFFTGIPGLSSAVTTES